MDHIDRTMDALRVPAPEAEKQAEPRKGVTPAAAMALTMALICASYVPVTDADARRAVEGTKLDEVA